jgi:tRNA-splicing ligase RtcB (3'-phosphate/5'-hydroxy nucleic acid ligase)
MGAVAAFDSEEGIISSGLCGFDINCGINLIRTNLTKKQVEEKSKELVDSLYNAVPVGVGGKGKLRLKPNELDDVLRRGLNWAVENGYGIEDDVKHTEEGGCMQGADPAKVSDLAKKRGGPQLGTLGAGNHFLEVQTVKELFDKETSKKWGITDQNQVMIMLHCGSRGLGHQVASDYLKIQEKAVIKYKIKLPDNQLVCAPASSQEGKDFFAAMQAAVNYSFVNRLVMTQWIRETFQKVFKQDWESLDMKTVYGICHNVIKLENHIVNGEKKKLFVHRKGATRSFPDEPVLIAGSMGTSSYLCKGTQIAMEKTFGSSAHGAGRAMSRNEAISKFRGQKIQEELLKKGIESKATSYESFAEEAPLAYKDVDEVIKSVHGSGISLMVAKLVPVGVIKG